MPAGKPRVWEVSDAWDTVWIDGHQLFMYKTKKQLRVVMTKHRWMRKRNAK